MAAKPLKKPKAIHEIVTTSPATETTFRVYQARVNGALWQARVEISEDDSGRTDTNDFPLSPTMVTQEDAWACALDNLAVITAAAKQMAANAKKLVTT